MLPRSEGLWFNSRPKLRSRNDWERGEVDFGTGAAGPGFPARWRPVGVL